MCCQEVLIVWVLNVPHYDAAADDKHIFARAWVQMHRVYNRAREADRVVKLNLAASGNFSLAEGAISDIRLRRCFESLWLCCNWCGFHHIFSQTF